MITIESSSEPDQNWNKRLLESKYGTIYQTKEIAKYFEKTVKYKNSYLNFLDQSGKIVGQLLLSEQDISQKNLIRNILSKISSKNKNLYRWIYGPVIFDNDQQFNIVKQLFDFLKSKSGYVSGSEHPLLSELFLNSNIPFKLKNWSTFLIDLTLSKNELWNNLNKNSARKNIKKSINRNVIVKEITKNDLKTYHSILSETKKDINHLNVELYDLEIQWDLLHDIGFSGFLAWENELPLGGLAVSYFNNYVNEWGVARANRDKSQNFYSQDLIKWKIIEWGIEKKFHYYDLTGANPNPKNSNEEGIFRYKQKWGGQMIPYNLVGI